MRSRVSLELDEDDIDAPSFISWISFRDAAGRVSDRGVRRGKPRLYAHSILAPVINRTVQRIRRSQSTGTRVLRWEPRMPPGIEPISREPTRWVSTLPARQCNRLVTPVKITAWTMSVPTMTLGANE